MPVRLFVASVGNPAPYLDTLHSAGHTFVDALAAEMQYPAFRRGLSASPAHRHALFKSSAYMNESGPRVVKAYRDWAGTLGPGDASRLVVVHDELEMKPGQVGRREPESSLRGHNGLKSIRRSLGGKDFMRLAVGIGRPEARTSRDVANYVLRKMTEEERRQITCRTPDAVDILNTMAEEDMDVP